MYSLTPQATKSVTSRLSAWMVVLEGLKIGYKIVTVSAFPIIQTFPIREKF
jgi:hypothetical protein